MGTGNATPPRQSDSDLDTSPVSATATLSANRPQATGQWTIIDKETSLFDSVSRRKDLLRVPGVLHFVSDANCIHQLVEDPTSSDAIWRGSTKKLFLKSKSEPQNEFFLLLVGTAQYANTGLTWESKFQQSTTSGGAWDMKLILGDRAKSELLHFLNATLNTKGVITNPIRLSLNRDDVDHVPRPRCF